MKTPLWVFEICIAAIVVGLATITGMVWAKRVSSVTWQQSQSPCIELAVRDKQGTLGAYKATFRVSAPDAESVATKSVREEDLGWGAVYFPSDFLHYEKNGRYWAAWNKPGKYSWSCSVQGRIVVGDKFQITKSGLVIDRW